MLAADGNVANVELQDRIHKASKYFYDKMGIFVDLVNKTNLTTDNKTAKKQFQDRFSTFEEDVKVKSRLLRYEQEAEFSVSDYLKKKAQYLLMEEGESDVSSSRKNRSGKSASGSSSSSSKGPKEPKIPTKEISLGLYNQGMSVEQIAAERGFTKGTIIGHLTPYVLEGKVGLRALISTAHEKKIRDFMESHPEMTHFGEIKEALGAGIDYYEIKLVHDLMEGEKE